MTNKFMDAALFYASKGWQVFPITPGQKAPPLVPWADEATTDAAQIKAWWTKTPAANVGIATGKRSGIVVLDIDNGHGGQESLMGLLMELQERIPNTPEATTGGGGRHYVFAHPGQEIRNSAGKVGVGIDIRGDGGYIVAPPSLHPSGRHYTWDDMSRPSVIELAPLPPWLARLATEQPQPIDPATHMPTPIYEGEIKSGGRNAALTSMAGAMRRRGMSTDAICQALQVENAKKCTPPLPDVEIVRIANSVSRYEPRQTTPVMRGQEQPIAASEPLDACGIYVEFMDLLANLEGRSIKTGIESLDHSLGGLERQNLTVLAARPSMGKSTLAWQIARNVAESGLKVLVFSLEMSAAALWAKAACGKIGIRWRDVRNLMVSEDDITAIIDTSTELMNLYGERLLVSDGVNTSETIFATVEKHKPDLVIVDHLRLVADRDDNEVIRLGMITQKQKDMAKQFNLAWLTLAQLNRGVESRDNKRPTLADLRDSGQIEENADVVLMMYRDDYYDTMDGKRSSLIPPAPSMTEILVRKFREDVLNQKVELSFAAKYQRFDPAPSGLRTVNLKDFTV